MTGSASRRKPFIAAAGLIVALVLVVLLRDPPDRFITRHHTVMGDILVTITVRVDDAVKVPDEEIVKAIRAAFARIDEIDARMSNYKDDSDVSRIRKAAGRPEPIQVSDDTFYVIQQAVAYAKKTDGAFDVTVRPLVALWKSRNERDPESPPKITGEPTDAEIAAVLKQVGYEKIELDEGNKTVRLTIQGMSIDLGAIAKGYAVDQAIAVLREKGFPNAWVEIGGEIYSSGTDEQGRPWTVRIRKPGPDREAILATLALSDAAVATSGDYERYLLIGGKRYNHILDPRTGRPVANGPHSVTVVAPTCMEADALATAITVLGTKQAKQLLRTHYPQADFTAIPQAETQGFHRHLRK